MSDTGEIFPAPLLREAQRLIDALRGGGDTIAFAESCTGGLVSALMTAIPGASDVLNLSFVTYSNAAKTEALAVPGALLDVHGAVSAEVAIAMAGGARKRAGSSFAISVTGIAGPGGGTAAKPVGLVFLGVASPGAATRVRELRLGELGRAAIRLKTVEAALTLALEAVERR